MQRRVSNVLKFILIALVSAICLLPFYFMIVMSTVTNADIFMGRIGRIGPHFLENVQTVLAGGGYLTSYKNSIIISAVAVFVNLLFSSMAGYALTVYRFPLRNACYNFILLSMMIPSSIGMIGYMQEMRVLGLSRSLVPMMLPWFANGFGCFWMTQFMKTSLQIEIVESARIDGSNEMNTFLQVIIPCIRPALGTLGLCIFLWSWNNYLLPLVMINNADNYTIPLYIRTLGNEHMADYAARITGLLLAIAPLMIAFTLGSKNFIKGLTAGAVKG